MHCVSLTTYVGTTSRSRDYQSPYYGKPAAVRRCGVPGRRPTIPARLGLGAGGGAWGASKSKSVSFKPRSSDAAGWRPAHKCFLGCHLVAAGSAALTSSGSAYSNTLQLLYDLCEAGPRLFVHRHGDQLRQLLQRVRLEGKEGEKKWCEERKHKTTGPTDQKYMGGDTPCSFLSTTSPAQRRPDSMP